MTGHSEGVRQRRLSPNPGAGEVGVVVTRHRVVLHGQPMSYLRAGHHSGPTMVLVHGLGGDAASWLSVLPLLGQHFRVLAPDLLGHGESAAPANGDYSVGGHASRLRDLLRTEASGPVNLVGHSYGGGVAMMFAYQFPERTHALALIASGGLGSELNLALRSASLPGVALAAGALAALAPPWFGQLVRLGAVAVGLAPRADLDHVGRALGSLAGRDVRRAFVHTLRGVVGWSGQRLDALDRLYLLAEVPTLLVAGSRDSCIPHHHTVRAHQAMPGSRLVILPTGHFPHVQDPDKIAQVLVEFFRGTASGPIFAQLELGRSA